MSRAAYLATLVGFVALTFTGFWGWFRAEGLRGWVLWSHMAVAPLFNVGLSILVWRLARRCRIHGDERPSIPFGQRVVFWLGAGLGLAAIVSAQLTMAASATTADQHCALDLHRWLSVGLLSVFLVHVILAVFTRSKSSLESPTP